MVGFCVDGNEPLGPIEGGIFFDQLNGYQLPKKNSSTWT
jgi:hypothetical protein